LKEILVGTTTRVLSANSRDDRDPEVVKIYRDVTGNDFDKEEVSSFCYNFDNK